MSTDHTRRSRRGPHAAGLGLEPKPAAWGSGSTGVRWPIDRWSICARGAGPISMFNGSKRSNNQKFGQTNQDSSGSFFRPPPYTLNSGSSSVPMDPTPHDRNFFGIGYEELESANSSHSSLPLNYNYGSTDTSSSSIVDTSKQAYQLFTTHQALSEKIVSKKAEKNFIDGISTYQTNNKTIIPLLRSIRNISKRPHATFPHATGHTLHSLKVPHAKDLRFNRKTSYAPTSVPRPDMGSLQQEALPPVESEYEQYHGMVGPLNGRGKAEINSKGFPNETSHVDYRALGLGEYYFQFEQMARLEKVFLKNLFYRNKFHKTSVSCLLSPTRYALLGDPGICPSAPGKYPLQGGSTVDPIFSLVSFNYQNAKRLHKNGRRQKPTKTPITEQNTIYTGDGSFCVVGPTLCSQAKRVGSFPHISFFQDAPFQIPMEAPISIIYHFVRNDDSTLLVGPSPENPQVEPLRRSSFPNHSISQPFSFESIIRRPRKGKSPKWVSERFYGIPLKMGSREGTGFTGAERRISGYDEGKKTSFCVGSPGSQKESNPFALQNEVEKEGLAGMVSFRHVILGFTTTQMESLGWGSLKNVRKTKIFRNMANRKWGPHFVPKQNVWASSLLKPRLVGPDPTTQKLLFGANRF